MKVLLVDDNQDIADAFRFYCESEQIDCETINDGKSGLSAIRTGNFDLVLLDIAIPEFSGLDVLKSLKADGMLEKKNVIVFIASSDPNMFEEIKDSGGKEILKKPCGMEELEQVFSRYRPNNSDLS